MRSEGPKFAALSQASEQSPRFVVSIEFEVESIYFTSHSGIIGVPGDVIDNVLQAPSTVSQTIVPDEARSEIGSMTVTLVDLDSRFTQEARQRLQDGIGLRGKTVRLYKGFSDPGVLGGGGYGSGSFGESGYGSGVVEELPDSNFADFECIWTQIIKSVEYGDGVYTISCSDITREQRKEIFEPKTTTLRSAVTATSTSIPVYTTNGFQPVKHGTSYSDGPSQTVGYVKIDDEVIRYTGITADSFTGCTRGVLNTLAAAHTFDAAATAERRPKVEEFIYIEMPAAKLIYAIQTGIIYGESASFPPHWHLGIDPNFVRLSDLTDIGKDLWDPADDAAGFVVRYDGLSKTDGKKFLEEELIQLLGCYSPIYSDGTIGLKRMNHVLVDAPYVVELNESNVVSWGPLTHDYNSLHNSLLVDWNWNGNDYTRRTIVVDAESSSIHGLAPQLSKQFKGLHGSRHTDSILRTRLDALRDRYSHPPERMDVSVMPSLSRLEVGDIVRVNLTNVRDFAGEAIAINRSFEIQKKSENHASGQITLSLFGSTGRASELDPSGGTATSALPDSYYISAGTNLTSVCTIVVVGGVGIIQPGTYTLTGTSDMNAASSVFYYDGDLQLADGAVLRVVNNVQLRVKGFFTINGDIDGIGRGNAGVADTGTYPAVTPGTPGFIGNSRGMDGLASDSPRTGYPRFTVPCAFTKGKFDAFPLLNLTVAGSVLTGIPSDMRGTSGGGGGKIHYLHANGISALGGTGGASGAGLTIVCRGMAFGASGLINLSGADSTSGSLVENNLSWSGAGGAGSPGAFLLLLDGSVSLPDIGGRFVARCGLVPINGTPITKRRVSGVEVFQWPLAGYLDESMISGIDISDSCYRIQYLLGEQTPQEDFEVPAPDEFIVAMGVEANVLKWIPPGDTLYDVVEVYASITNNRPDAVKLGEVRGEVFMHSTPFGQLYYYWIRARKTIKGRRAYSLWSPESATEGQSLASLTAFQAHRAIIDSEFSITTDQTYWYWGSATGVSISLTGGVVDGRMILVGDGTTKRACSIRPQGYKVVTGQQFKLYCRWRRVSTLSHAVGAADSLLFGAITTLSANDPFGIYNGSGYASVTGTSMDAVNVNEWQESSVTVTTTNFPKTSTQLPYISFYITLTNNCLSGTVEIDALVATPI